MTLAALEKVSSGQVISSDKERGVCEELVESLSVKIAGLEQKVMRKGRIAGEFPRGAKQEEILGLMLEAEKA